MKKIIYSIAASLLLLSCTRDNINLDSNSAYTNTASTLLPYAQKALSDYITTPNVNENNSRLLMQYWTETIYTQESNYDYASRSVSDQIYLDNYVYVLENLTKAKEFINSYSPTPSELATWPAIKANQLAIIDMLMVYTYQNLVDTFGNIPYTESNKFSSIVAPKYDDAATIYADLINRMDANINSLSGTTSFGTADLYYSGSIPKWKKFGASLMLKLGIALADSNPTLAQATVTKAISYGPITSASDDCVLTYLASPNYNPAYYNVYANGRTDFVAADPLMNFMKTSGDKRISKYFLPNNTDGTYTSSPVGLPAAATSGGIDALSLPGSFTRTSTTPGILINSCEVNFYLAEAAKRWGLGNPSTYYNAAITASFAQWGLSSDAAAYLSAHPYDDSNWKKSIGEQAWVSMYNQSLTSWNFWRRLDYPQLQPATYAASAAENKIPVRMVYSNREASTNAANVAAAATAIGGDKMTTKLFWDKN